MKATELRIGNYVEYNGMFLQVSEIYSPKPRQPKRFDGVECVELVCDGFITAVMTDTKPVPITEEVLLKCGFERLEYNDYRHPVLIGTLTLYEGVAELHISDMYSVWINNLHQLQNLFYCLCGGELEINL